MSKQGFLFGLRFTWLFLVFLAFIFWVGWFGWPETEKTYSDGFEINIFEMKKTPIQIENTHLLGLRFMPACTPFGGNATCGLDLLFIGPLLIGFLFCVFEIIGLRGGFET